jgi:phosphoribosylformylglycinamidine (FGAM) synthase-like enzyme
MKDFSSIFTPDDIQFIEGSSDEPVTNIILNFIGLAISDQVKNREYYSTIRHFDAQEKREISSNIPINKDNEIIVTNDILQLSGKSYKSSNPYSSVRKLLIRGAKPVSDIRELCYMISDKLTNEILGDIQKQQRALAKTFSFSSWHCSLKNNESITVPTVYATTIGMRSVIGPIDTYAIKGPLLIVWISFGSNKASGKRDQLILTFSKKLMTQSLVSKPVFVDQQGLLPSLIKLMCQNNTGCSIKIDIPQDKAINWFGPKSTHGCLVIASSNKTTDIIKSANQSGFISERIGHITNEHSCSFIFNDGNKIDIPLEIFHHFHKHHFGYDIHTPAVQKSESALKLRPRKSYNPVLVKVLQNCDSVSNSSLVQIDSNTHQISGNNSPISTDTDTIPESIFAAIADNTSFVRQDSRLGGQIAVANALRQLVCAGCTPQSIILKNVLPRINSNTINNIQENGMAILMGQEEAVRQFNTQISSRLVYSNDEEFDQHIVAIGTKSHTHSIMTEGFKNPGDFISILGSHRGELGGSLFSSLYLKRIQHTIPSTDLGMEKRLHDVILHGIRGGLIRSATNVSQGGLAIAIARSLIRSDEGIGARIFLSRKLTNEELLFGETQGLIVISLGEKDIMEFERICMRIGVPSTTIGRVTDTGKYTFNDLLNIRVKRLP